MSGAGDVNGDYTREADPSPPSQAIATPSTPRIAMKRCGDERRAFPPATRRCFGAQGSFLSAISSEANHAARSAMSASVRGFATTVITSCARLPLR